MRLTEIIKFYRSSGHYKRTPIYFSKKIQICCSTVDPQAQYIDGSRTSFVLAKDRHTQWVGVAKER